MGGGSGISDPALDRDALVANPRSDQGEVSRPGENASQESVSVEGKKWALAKMDGLINPDGDWVLAESTLIRYRKILWNYLVWLWSKRKEERKGETKRNRANEIQSYLDALAVWKSGENVVTVGTIIVNVFKRKLSLDEREKIMNHIRYLRRQANRNNPPVQKPADAVSWRSMLRMIHCSRVTKVSRLEEVALEIFIISFSTISRCSEIENLTIEDVSPSGTYIRVRPKTYSKDWKYFYKCLRDVECVRPTCILRWRRECAIREHRRYLFTAREDGDSPVTTQQVTSALRKLTRKFGMHERITAHSARKGAAVEVLFAGTPLVAIKSRGTWSQLDTLEAYLGKTIRQQVPVSSSFLRRLEVDLIGSY